jgi:hypothetical protein
MSVGPKILNLELRSESVIIGSICKEFRHIERTIDAIQREQKAHNKLLTEAIASMHRYAENLSDDICDLELLKRREEDV